MDVINDVLKNKKRFIILNGDVLDRLKEIPNESIHCVVTSPPYWQLRDYGVEASVWGGNKDCAHNFDEYSYTHHPGQVEQNITDGKTSVSTAQTNTKQLICTKCNAWKGCLGLEPDPDSFVEHLVEVFSEVNRVLRDDGILWVNISDTYGAANGYNHPLKEHSGRFKSQRDYTNKRPKTVKKKEMVGIPWRFAFAMMNSGWTLRQQIIWVKSISFAEGVVGSIMPESVKDRCSRAAEDVFMFTKEPEYYSDFHAVREKGVFPPGTKAAKGSNERLNQTGVNARPSEYAEYSGTRNLRNVWFIPNEPSRESHYASYPIKLPSTCIKITTSEKGCCSKCGSPWKRIVEKEKTFESGSGRSGNSLTGKNNGNQFDGNISDVRRGPVLNINTVGWESTCKCNEEKTLPCTVLDPFSGSGTTGIAAMKLGLNYIGIELNKDYIDISEKRLSVWKGQERLM